jgi:oxygen-independent coproporphyrinogen-3 oxidase
MKILNVLKRKHKLKDSHRAIYLARALGFENFGVGMLYGLPRQTGKDLSDDLNQLTELSPPHVSYYRLIAEKNTPLYKKVKSKKIKMPDKNLRAAMYLAINDELSRHNYFRYEISSWSLPGFECRHNFSYWEGGEYLGLGPSAHSYINKHRMANSVDLKLYINKLKNNQRPLVYDRADKESRITEAVMLGLRTVNGINRASFRKQFGLTIDEALNGDAYQILLKGGFIKSTKTAIKLTKIGFPVADEIIKRLVR